MQTSDKIIEILKNDPEANKMMAKLNNIANEAHLSKEEYLKLREFTLLSAMYLNPEAMKVMADSCFRQLNEADSKKDEQEYNQIWHESVKGF